MRTVVLMATMVVGLLLIPRIATGQSCGPYDICFVGGDHKVPCPLGSGVQNCHTGCGTCISGDCHPDCFAFSLNNPQESRRYALLLKLASALDIEGLVAEARSTRGRVFYSPERDAVQVVGCDGISIVANLPFRSVREKLLALAELPDASAIGGFLTPPWRIAGGRQLAARPVTRR